VGLEFIDRLLRTTAVVVLIFLPFGLFYLGVYPSIAVFSGCVWGMLNLLLITRLIRLTIRPDGPSDIKSITIVAGLFLLLFAAGYGLLKVDRFAPWLLLTGFTSLFAIMFLKAVGRWITKADDRALPDRKPEQAA
jgi:hypothetical protein